MGKSHDDNIVTQIRANVIVCSDRASSQIYEDKAGPMVTSRLRIMGFTVADIPALVADEPDQLEGALTQACKESDLIVVTGGTGISPRDITPQTLDGFCDYSVPGIGEFLRLESFKFSANAYFSRCGAWVKGTSLVLALPGSPKAVIEQLDALGDMLKHAIDAVKGTCKHRHRTKETTSASHECPTTHSEQALCSYSEALEIIQAIAPLGTTEFVGLEQAAGGVLAADLLAPMCHPPFTNSAVDGYAFKFSALSQHTLSVHATRYAQTSPSQANFDPTVACLRIMTGAPLSENTDTVVPIEHTKIEADGRVTFLKVPKEGANVRLEGSDLRAQAPLFSAGTYLTPEAVLVCASLGIHSLPIVGKARIGLFVTGDELITPGELLPPGGIYDSTRFFLGSACAKLGLALAQSSHLPDDLEVAEAGVRAFFTGGPALLLTTGAVSAGEKDFIPALAEKLGFQTLFHKVAVRPGKPIFFARRGEALWMGLPGNPISTVSSWHYFVRPLLSRWLGIPPPRKFLLTLAADVIKPTGFRSFYRAVITGNQVQAAANQGSGNLLASLTANAYIELPENIDRAPQGSPCLAITI